MQKHEKCFEFIKPTGIYYFKQDMEKRRAHMAQKLHTFCANGWHTTTTTYLETDLANLERDEDDHEHPSKAAAMALITQIAVWQRKGMPG